MAAPANPLETFITQFVQALQPPQTPEVQAVCEAFKEIVKPAFSALTEIAHTIEQYHPTVVQDLHLGDIGNFFHALLDSHCATGASSAQGFLSDFSNGLQNELHKAWDFYL